MSGNNWGRQIEDDDPLAALRRMSGGGDDGKRPTRPQPRQAVRRLPLDVINARDNSTQPRVELNKATVEEYAEAMRRGDQFPPVDVFYDGSTYWLADGWHRYYGAQMAGLTEIGATIHQGGQREAVLFAVGVNAEHGLRRTNEDKRKAVLILLSDEEWSQWGNREIARRARVSHAFVNKLREEVSGNGFQMRKVRRGDQTYEMDTAGLMEADRRRRKVQKMAQRFGSLRKWKLAVQPQEMSTQERSALRDEIRAAREHLAQLEDALGDE